MSYYELTLMDERGGACTHYVQEAMSVSTERGPLAPTDLEIGAKIIVAGYTFTLNAKQTVEGE